MLTIAFFIWLIGATVVAIWFGIDSHDYPIDANDAVAIMLTILFWFFALMILLGQYIGHLKAYGS